jgi:ribosomal protein S18 acetylase RimI-like enzyme
MTVIRAITDADIDAIAEIHVRAWRSAYAGIVPDHVLAALDPVVFAERRRHRPVPPGARTLVAQAGDGLAGFANFGPERAQDGGESDPDAAELYAIYLDPACQGRGIGRLLISAATTALRQDGFAEMRLWVLTENHPARGFYERMGLAPDGTTNVWTPNGSTAELPELRYSVRL